MACIEASATTAQGNSYRDESIRFSILKSQNALNPCGPKLVKIATIYLNGQKDDHVLDHAPGRVQSAQCKHCHEFVKKSSGDTTFNTGFFNTRMQCQVHIYKHPEMARNMVRQLT